MQVIINFVVFLFNSLINEPLQKHYIFYISVISLYNEQLKTVQNILGRAMLNNIDDFRRNANMLIGITVTALIFIALVEPFLFWANISK